MDMKFLNVGNSLLDRRLSNKLFRLEVHLWDSIMPVDANKFPKAFAGEKEKGGDKK